MSLVLFFESTLGLVASRLRSAQNEINFLINCDLRDTRAMLSARQELNQAEVQHDYLLNRLQHAMKMLPAEERLRLCNHARTVGFSLLA